MRAKRYETFTLSSGGTERGKEYSVLHNNLIFHCSGGSGRWHSTGTGALDGKGRRTCRFRSQWDPTLAGWSQGWSVEGRKSGEHFDFDLKPRRVRVGMKQGLSGRGVFRNIGEDNGDIEGHNKCVICRGNFL